MKTIQKTPFRAVGLLLLLPVLVWMSGCDVDSVDSVSATLSDNSGTIYNFSGLYMNPGNATSTNGIRPIVFPNQGNHKPTGELIRSLRILQYGSVLEGYDSAGLTWYGNISSMQGTAASFTLSGRTTIGNPVEIAGTMNYADQQSTLNATWIEPNYYGSIIAQATVTPASTNTPTSTLSASASPDSISDGASSTLTAFNGDGSYSWSESSSYASLSSTTGSSVSLTRSGGTSSDSVQVTVTSGGETANVTVNFN